ncbi:GntR family transcriptional regulator [Streptomyces sp. V4-01]|uniref:GntR family transcriptional regulator n=1 Tax=Actinacidiphila polyblastidii TaxID=3110430 RepID=A0ABU7PJ70_9ACTN|nr:GntR family transcriptional regulator [Streptomyces sp. V4-01]
MTARSVEVPEKLAHPDEVSRAHHELRRAIMRGELSAGDPLSQVELARRLGVSRGPLREALRILQREGFVQQESQHRARVTAFSDEDLDELYAMRISLEALAIGIAVPRMTDEDLSRLDQLLQEMDETARTGDVELWERPHEQFHRALVRLAGPRLERELALLSDHATRYRLAFVSWNPLEWQAGTSEQHRTIAEAAKSRDADAAARALAAHLGRTALVVLSIASPTYEPVRIRRALATACGT